MSHIKLINGDNTELYNSLRKIKQKGRNVMITFKNDWQELLQSELEKPYFRHLQQTLLKEKSTIFPNEADIYQAFHETTYEHTKVVILGQVI